jgi:uncharacterized protein (TIGR00251 family)
MERVKVIVKPNSPKNKINYDDSRLCYRVELKAKPKEGEANLELIKFLSKHFKKRVKIVSGFKSRIKTIIFED